MSVNRECLIFGSTMSGSVDLKVTALILKRIRDSLFGSHYDLPWPENTDLIYLKFHFPTWKQFQRV